MFSAERTIYRGRKGTIFFLGMLVCMVWGLVFWSMFGSGICVADAARDGIDFGNSDPGRYSIFDRNFTLMATSFNLTVVYVLPPELPDIKVAASRLAPIMAMDKKELLRKIRNFSSYVRLPGHLTTAAADRIRAMDMKGVYLVGEPRRFYPHGSLASHLIGFTREGRGLSGVEALFDHELRRGKVSGVTGNEARGNVVLTVDLDLQRRLESGLARIRQESGAGKAMAGVIEVNSGDILAQACAPGFDPNHFWDYKSARVINSFSGFRREWPGLVGFLALTANDDAGGNVFIRVSSTPGFAGGEYDSVANQGPAGVTSLEAMVALARMINGGREMTPHLKKIMWRRDRGFFSPFSWHGATPTVTAAESRAFLDAVKNRAENNMVFIDAAIANDNSPAGPAFAAFYPAQKPRLALLVAIDDLPVNVHINRRHLKDIVGDILRYAATVNSTIVPPDRREMAVNREAAGRKWQASLPGSTVSVVAKSRESTAMMPDLVGMSLRRALRLVQPLGVRVRVIGSGRVTAQSPGGGMMVNDDDLVTLELAAQS